MCLQTGFESPQRIQGTEGGWAIVPDPRSICGKTSVSNFPFGSWDVKFTGGGGPCRSASVLVKNFLEVDRCSRGSSVSCRRRWQVYTAHGDRVKPVQLFQHGCNVRPPRCPADQTLYCFYRNQVNLSRKRLQRLHYRRSVEQLGDNNPHQWWKDIKRMVGMSKSNNKLQGLANTVCEGNLQELTTRINSFFEFVTADFQPITPGEVFHIGPDCSVPEHFTITVSDVEKQLSCLNTNKAPGPDGVPAWFLKEYAELLSGPVCCIFNSSLRDGYIPVVWKSADVCPLPKVPAPSLIEKHLRPISLTPVPVKCLERHVTGWILDYMDGSIDPHQFGSLQGSSAVHALVELLHLWHKALDTPGNMVRVVMLDFAKAFDRVDHTTVLKKLANLGLPNFLVRWLTEFLCELAEAAGQAGPAPVEMVTSQGWSAAGYPGGTHQLFTAYQWPADSSKPRQICGRQQPMGGVWGWWW